MQNEVEQYIYSQTKNQQVMLEELRYLIKKMAPLAEEKMSYGVICFIWLGMLVGIGTKKGHVSFYTTRSELKSLFPKEMENIIYKGTTIHFPENNKLPIGLIKKVVQLKIKLNKEKHQTKVVKTNKA
jgi:uncharacterized protein YdhG (YjbR/CyaY superfamily)